MWVAVLPHASEAKKWFNTVNTPEEGIPSVSASHVTSTAVQLSDATGSTTSMLAAQSTKVSGGSVVHTGGAKSKNTAAVLAVLWLPQASVAV